MHYAYMELERFDNRDDPCFNDYDNVDPVYILQKSYEESMSLAEKEVCILLKNIVIYNKMQDLFIYLSTSIYYLGYIWIMHSLFSYFTS